MYAYKLTILNSNARAGFGMHAKAAQGSGAIKRALKKSHPIKRRREEEKGEFTHFYATHSPKPAKNLRLRRTTCALRAHNGAQRRDSVAP